VRDGERPRARVERFGARGGGSNGVCASDYKDKQDV
jgi:hypothetical protein